MPIKLNFLLAVIFTLAITTQVTGKIKVDYNDDSRGEIRLTDENDKISLEVNQISKNVLNFILRENGKERFEMPKEEPFPYHKNKTTGNIEDNIETDYQFDLVKEPFSVTIKRNSTGEEIFSTKNMSIVLGENYAELTTTLPSEYLFGLGERTTSFKLKPGTYLIYNRDAYGAIDDGTGAMNRYGSHPMYLMREKSGFYHIIYLRNTFPMDVVFAKQGDVYTLTYKIVGGILDFSLFMGDRNPETSIKMYHDFLGKSLLPPFWSLGFHQCRWGYHDLDTIHDVLEKYKEHKLPLDTIWMDIDYMEEFVPFTVDETRYNMTEFKSYLHSYRKKFVMIAEPAMSIKWPDYEYLVKGKELDLFIKNKEGNYLINKVWPGECYFIDYFNPKTEAYWHDALDHLHDKLGFSGVWLDMNEVATFEPGQVNEKGERISCDDDTVYPYLPGNVTLERNTICPNAKHYGGLTHAQVHNYNPVAQQMLTYKYLERKYPDSFPFILSRANAAGTGKYSFHWTGDNVGSFEFYKGSVSEVMNNNLFGIPMVGADICGFVADTPENLCAKFYQMGSLFPFSRSHSANDTIRKEPWTMGETLLETTQKSLNFRYQILKYYYSLFLSTAGTGSVFRPLFFNFFDDDIEVLKDQVIDNQFMIGEDLLVIPNFNNDTVTTKVNAYFPKGDWYDLRYNTKVNANGTYSTVDAVLKEMPPVFLRGGKTIFTNDVEYVDTTYDLNTNYNFLISFNSTQGDNLVSYGRIPALLDYHSKQRVNRCVENNCFIAIRSFYYPKDKMFVIDFSKAAYYDKDYTYMTALSFRVYGLNIKGLVLYQSNLDGLIEMPTQMKTVLGYQKKFIFRQKVNKFEIKYVNENYFILQINGVLKVKTDTVDLVIKFK